MPRNKHLTLDERIDILIMLKAHCSFRHIARQLDKSPNCIAQEVKKHRMSVDKGCLGHRFNNCIHRRQCPETFLCQDRFCPHEFCVDCKKACCTSLCPSYSEEECERLTKAPYVCEGCKDRGHCTLRKWLYYPKQAQNQYETTLTESRSGFSYTPEEIQEINELVSPGLKRGLAPHVVYEQAKNELICSERTIYRLVEANQLEADSFDLPFKVRYRPRRKYKSHKIDTKCRVNRTFQDFMQFLTDNPDTNFVEMDSIIGKPGSACLLSIYLHSCDFLLLFLREKNNAQTVINIFDSLDQLLGRELFQTLFPVILTDNGSEFSNPKAIEFDSKACRRTRVFFCDPGVPNQKAAVEGAHKHVRRVLPKGSSFDGLTQKDINLLVANLNGFKRKKLNNSSPTELFSFLFGQEVLDKLGIPFVAPDALCLTPKLLK